MLRTTLLPYPWPLFVTMGWDGGTVIITTICFSGLRLCSSRGKGRFQDCSLFNHPHIPLILFFFLSWLNRIDHLLLPLIFPNEDTETLRDEVTCIVTQLVSSKGWDQIPSLLPPRQLFFPCIWQHVHLTKCVTKQSPLKPSGMKNKLFKSFLFSLAIFFLSFLCVLVSLFLSLFCFSVNPSLCLGFKLNCSLPAWFSWFFFSKLLCF